MPGPKPRFLFLASRLTQIDPKAQPGKRWKLSQDARKGKKADDLAAFLVGVNDYLQARADLVKVTMEIRRAGR